MEEFSHGKAEFSFQPPEEMPEEEGNKIPELKKLELPETKENQSIIPPKINEARRPLEADNEKKSDIYEEKAQKDIGAKDLINKNSKDNIATTEKTLPPKKRRNMARTIDGESVEVSESEY